MNKERKYYHIDLNVKSMKVVRWGISNTATLTGETSDINVRRVFLTKGQYNKVVRYLK